MPEEVPAWIVNETPRAFSRGDVFVSPAEFVGLDADVSPRRLDALTDVTSGSTVIPEGLAAATTLMNLDLPYVDGMSANDFQSFVDDHAGELVEFRSAFLDLVRGKGDRSSIKSRLENEIAEFSGG